MPIPEPAPTPPLLEYTVIKHRLEGADLLVDVEWTTVDADGELTPVLVDQLRFNADDSAEAISAALLARARDYVAPRYLAGAQPARAAASDELDALVGRPKRLEGLGRPKGPAGGRP